MVLPEITFSSNILAISSESPPTAVNQKAREFEVGVICLLLNADGSFNSQANPAPSRSESTQIPRDKLSEMLIEFSRYDKLIQLLPDGGIVKLVRLDYSVYGPKNISFK
jgi:hypothetical protein